MSRRIILLYPSYTYPRKNPPLGLAYLASYIRRAGFDPMIVDLNVDDFSDEVLTELVVRERPLAVAVSFMTNQYGESLRLAALVKAASSSTPVIVGGPHVSALPEEILKQCPAIDFSVIGEGEVTFGELLGALAAGQKRYHHIDGICFRDNGSIVKTGPRALIEDVDALAFPAWDLVRLEKYSVFSIDQGKTFPLLSSRGCPSQCIFCDSHTIFGRRFRARSARNIFSEIEFLHKEYAVTQFDFVDDMITLKKDRVFELCRLIKQSGIPFKWMANARVNTLSSEMLGVMKESGCIRIDVGVESGDPAVRKTARKGTTNEQIVNAHKWASEAGVQIGSFVMVGNLGETKESVKMTAELLSDIGEDVMIAIACPFPGTELYQIAKERGYLRDADWSHYVTSPTYLKNYEPVMVTDKMTQSDILDAYYYLHSIFAKRKFQARYGRFFLLNPSFIREWLLKSADYGGLLRKISMFIRMVKARFS